MGPAFAVRKHGILTTASTSSDEPQLILGRMVFWYKGRFLSDNKPLSVSISHIQSWQKSILLIGSSQHAIWLRDYCEINAFCPVILLSCLPLNRTTETRHPLIKTYREGFQFRLINLPFSWQRLTLKEAVAQALRCRFAARVVRERTNQRTRVLTPPGAAVFLQLGRKR